jgi:conjugal transfer pilus assembly protein TraU
LITDICWDCIFPIKVGGINMSAFADLGSDSSANDPQNSDSNVGSNPSISFGSVPDDAVSNPFCVCDDGVIPKPGISLGFWVPARLEELVRTPGCLMSLNGAQVDLNDRLMGTRGIAADPDHSDLLFYNYHEYAFPLLEMLSLFLNTNCVTDGYTSMDVTFMSEVDPTWNYDELSFFEEPESALVANPVALASCAIEAASATAGHPIDSMFWCAGSWGHLYPLAGNEAADGSMARQTSVEMTRVLAILHRRGLAWRTMGSDVQCKAQLDPMIPKSQYKMSMFFPLAEANGAHVIGQSDYTWGAWRHIPGTGEDAVYLIFRWQDCCLR